jgi:hypothetical protein
MLQVNIGSASKNSKKQRNDEYDNNAINLGFALCELASPSNVTGWEVKALVKCCLCCRESEPQISPINQYP